jgi:hypothetical protein
MSSPPPPDWSDTSRRLLPLVEQPVDGAPTKATQLDVDGCSTDHARALINRWHSRLPTTQRGPWTHAFRCHWHGYTYAVALWNTPSARSLPDGLLELRRMAVAPDAPHCTASRMLAQMAKRLAASTNVRRLISYQDDDVHRGTIYAAAGWTRAAYSPPRQRQRSGYARPTRSSVEMTEPWVDIAPTLAVGREYRTAINGVAPDHAGKWRWEFDLVENC